MIAIGNVRHWPERNTARKSDIMSGTKKGTNHDYLHRTESRLFYVIAVVSWRWGM
jgi:hypothetical protein